jgi:hypothetical protein
MIVAAEQKKLRLSAKLAYGSMIGANAPISKGSIVRSFPSGGKS